MPPSASSWNGARSFMSFRPQSRQRAPSRRSGTVPGSTRWRPRSWHVEMDVARPGSRVPPGDALCGGKPPPVPGPAASATRLAVGLLALGFQPIRSLARGPSHHVKAILWSGTPIMPLADPAPVAEFCWSLRANPVPKLHSPLPVCRMVTATLHAPARAKRISRRGTCPCNGTSENIRRGRRTRNRPNESSRHFGRQNCWHRT